MRQAGRMGTLQLGSSRPTTFPSTVEMASVGQLPFGHPWVKAQLMRGTTSQLEARR